MAKRVVSKKKVIRFSILIGIILVLIIGAVFLIKGLKKAPNKAQDPIKVVDKIEDYGYQLDENETAYYKKIFNELKSTLSKETVEEESYASLIAQLFVTDFFNLENKLTKNDIGGTQFIYQSYQSDFEKSAKDGIYHYVESNIYQDRKQELPEVVEVIVSSVKQESFTYGDKKDSKAYTVKLTISYEKDLGYQKEATLVLIHNDKKLEIAKMD